MSSEIQVFTDPTPITSKKLTEQQMEAVDGGIVIEIAAGMLCNWGFGLGVAAGIGVAVVILAVT